MDIALSKSTAPKVFISYSWTTQEHQDWVLKLAERLRSDGVDIIFDKWDLKHGQDMIHFMEQLTHNKELKRVLMICDKGYTDKVNDRKGGAGIEAQIISPEVYKELGQEKFVPVVVQRDDHGNPYIPTYLKTRFHIDMSTPELEQENYDVVIRNIFDRPQNQKPALGVPPKHIFEDRLPSPTFSKFQVLKNAVMTGKHQLMLPLTKDYLNSFVAGIKPYSEVAKGVEPLDQRVKDRLDAYLEYRNEFLAFLEFVIPHAPEYELSEELAVAFETLLSLKCENNVSGSKAFYSFVLYELFIYTLTVAIREKKDHLFSQLVDRTYFCREPHGELVNRNVKAMYSHEDLWENQRANRLGKGEATAGLIRERATITSIPLRLIAETDIITYIRGALKNDKPCWYPKLLTDRTTSLDLFIRACSRRHFTFLAKLLDCMHLDNFNAKLKDAVTKGYFRAESVYTDWDELMNLGKLDQLP